MGYSVTQFSPVLLHLYLGFITWMARQYHCFKHVPFPLKDGYSIHVWSFQSVIEQHQVPSCSFIILQRFVFLFSKINWCSLVRKQLICKAVGNTAWLQGLRASASWTQVCSKVDESHRFSGTCGRPWASSGTIIKRKSCPTLNFYSSFLVPLSALMFCLSVSSEEGAWSSFPETSKSEGALGRWEVQ